MIKEQNVSSVGIRVVIGNITINNRDMIKRAEAIGKRIDITSFGMDIEHVTFVSKTVGVRVQVQLRVRQIVLQRGKHAALWSNMQGVNCSVSKTF